MDGSSSSSTLQGSPIALDSVDLIKTVRGLDQNGPGHNGENLELLWRSLTASAVGQFHAAEESTLRWLLKSMNGASKEAETMRRWPLTWKILECVFQRIPLFSLAKSLADRRFIAILHQTLSDASKPVSAEGATTSAKRKRSKTPSYALDDLNDHEGCLATGDAVFHALKRLLDRMDAPATRSSHDRIGAEHVRSLFCTAANEAAILASLALRICELALRDGEAAEDRETWIETISSMWNLHLQGLGDTQEVATHLFGPSAAILGKLNDNDTEPMEKQWNKDIQTFMHRNLILPSRAAYFSRQDFGAFEIALEVSKSYADVAVPALYILASNMSGLQLEGKSRKVNAEWMKQVFKSCEQTIRGRNQRDTVVQKVLARAAEMSMPVDNSELRLICREYAMKETETNWRLVADVASCDPDVFQLSEDGAGLLKEVCNRSTAKDLKIEDHEALAVVIRVVLKGFQTGRDFSGFLKLWFKQLCKVEKHKSGSPWLKVYANKDGEPLETIVEKELSAQQLLEVLESVEEHKSHSRALCLFLNTIAQGIRSEVYMDAVGKKLFDLVSSVSKTSSTLTSLKWGVVSRTISWVTPVERTEIWAEVKGQLSKILSGASIQSRETFEAFKCCCQVWTTMSPDDELLDEPAKLVEAFVNRLATELITSKAFKGLSISPYLKSKSMTEFSEDEAIQYYLSWFLRGSTRFSHLFSKKTGALPQPLQNAVTSSKIDVSELERVWENLLENENNVNDAKVVADLIDRLITSTDEDEKTKKWPGESSQVYIRSLSTIPTDAFSRPQRERIMTTLNKHRSKATKRVSEEGWKLVLGLSAKMMGRPTFYDGLSFTDNVEIADAMANIQSKQTNVDGTMSDFIDIFFNLASLTIRQMADHVDERSIKFFEESQKFVTNCESADDLSPFRLTLLKALAVETAKAANLQSNPSLASLPHKVREALGKCVMSSTSHFITEKKAFRNEDIIADLKLLAAVDAAQVLSEVDEGSKPKKSEIRKAEKRSHEAALAGDLRGWKLDSFLRTYFASSLEEPRPTSFWQLDNLPAKLHQPLIKSKLSAITREMDVAGKLQYLGSLVEAFKNGSETDGQILAIQQVVNQLTELADLQDKADGYDLAMAQSDMTCALASAKSPTLAVYIIRVLLVLLEKKPQSMAQWNIELTLNTVCDLASVEAAQQIVPFAWLCKLVEVIIKKHRLRLEGHHHILLTAMQNLLRNLINVQAPSDPKALHVQEAKAHMYTRLVTLICEPTAGAVSRSQYQSSLDSATDLAKRSIGRHMYLVLMQYVKLQLEADVPRAIREALEPAVNSVFDVTPPEVRKILNDAMDGSGRALLREMYRRYTRFGKWSGV